MGSRFFNHRVDLFLFPLLFRKQSRAHHCYVCSVSDYFDLSWDACAPCSIGAWIFQQSFWRPYSLWIRSCSHSFWNGLCNDRRMVENGGGRRLSEHCDLDGRRRNLVEVPGPLVGILNFSRSNVFLQKIISRSMMRKTIMEQG